METTFYAIGGALVVIALIISAMGMRNDDFPSQGALRIGVLFVALVVIATGYTAVQAAQEEAAHREEEESLLADEEAAEIEAENAEEAGGGSASGTQEEDPEAGGAPGDDQQVVEPGGGSTASLQAGSAVFVDQGCGSCHTLADQGDLALGAIGPNLDAQLVDQDAAYIETAIVDPSADVVEGFGDNVMPSDYGELIEPADLEALVAYLDEVTSEDAPASSGAGAG